ncbi:MAG: hypothetical protein CVV44_16910 [Spirochaetae bacterium HGW-Spirochaetae-1]|jgi:methyl-accepting chemotaxis protein|nr:MAG: hypothetical protein CVV44_16910 [Spirochaetae bacterium HGW-Spirochaetae-1]
MYWKNMSIQTKILSIGGIVILSFLLVMFIYVLPVIKKTVYDMKKEKIMDIVDTTVATINGMYQDHINGVITEKEFRENAFNYVRRIRYGRDGNDYVWINDFRPFMVMHPLRPDLNDKDLSDYKDPSGKKLFVEMVQVCKKNNAGYVQYIWQYKQDKNRLEPKISYVKTFAPLNWIIGTGVYEADIREEIAGRLVNLQIRIAIVFTIITGLLALLIYLVSRNIKSGIAQCAAFAEELARGNLKERIELDQNDEIGTLAKTLNVSADNLENLVANVVENANRLTTVVEQIAGGNQQLSQMNTEQASSLEEIASSIEEAVAGISSNADNAQKAERLSLDAARTADESASVVLGAIDSIGKISESSSRIAEITAMINEIAFQTNLLALNAAVEAARAGEQGRGFAVVAAEVRSLAGRAREAAKEINGVIAESMISIHNATEMGTKSREALRLIRESIGNVGEVVREIASASDEQRHGMQQINTAMMQMDKITQENSSLVEETASVSEEMSAQAVEMRTLTEMFSVRMQD